MKEHKFPYEWTLKDAKFTKDKGKVFSCFACGGGSTMGYKLAGFDVIGCNEIDPKMMEVYRINHKPKYSFLEPIQTFKLRKDLPKELYSLDILDGSPPCSSFSMAGNREKDWGKEKKFREGQQNQVLDNLFFDFIDLVKELQPKIVVAENVKGLMIGNAKEYVRRIYKSFKEAGYQLRIRPYLLDASTTGVPQRRERVFFIALRNDLAGPFIEKVDMFQDVPRLKLNFNEPEIPFKYISDSNDKKEVLTELYIKYWDDAKPGDPVGAFKTNKKLNLNEVATTLTTRDRQYHPSYKRRLNDLEISKEQTFPIDYNYFNTDCNYLCGMSVPPIMIAQIASNIYDQWLSKIITKSNVNQTELFDK